MAHATLAAMFGRPPAPRLSLKIAHALGADGSGRWSVSLQNTGRGVARSVLLRLRLAHRDIPDPTALLGVLTPNGLPLAPAPGWLKTRDPRPPDFCWWFLHGTEVFYPDDSDHVCTFGLPGGSPGWTIGGIDAVGAQPVRFEGALPAPGDALELPEEPD